MRYRIILSATTLVFALALQPGPAAGEIRQLTDSKDTSFDWAMPIGNGSEIIVVTSSDQFAGGGNPEHYFQIASFNPTTGVGTPLTSFTSSITHVRHNVSVSDDGQWLAFISNGEVIPGQNANRNGEVYVMKHDGTSLTQLTNDATPDAGSATRIALAGSGNRIAFASSGNLTGGNPQRAQQVFVIDRDGSNLTQLTQAPTGTVDHMWISDDGNRIAFSHNGDLTGGNPDRNFEVFTIAVGDTSPRQITSSTTGNSTGANISGNGNTIVWESTANPTGGNADGGLEIFQANWTTPTITQVTNSVGGVQNRESRQPWPTNDGLVIFFASNQTPVVFPTAFEIFKINTNGTGKTKLTSLNLDAEHPVVSGDGTRFATWLEGGLYTATSTGTNLVQLIVRSVPDQGYPDISTDGRKVAFISETNPLGTNADGSFEIFHMNTDRTGLAQLTSSTLSPSRPAITGDGSRVYFESAYNPLGTNDGNDEVFGVNADGTGVIQYTSCLNDAFQFSGYPEVSDNGNVVLFTSLCDLTGGNADKTGEIFKINPNGTGLTQLTSFPSVVNLTTYVYWPRLDAVGDWFVMSGNANIAGGNPDNHFEVWRMRTNGTGLQQITSDPVYDSAFPDISADATRIVFSSTADLTGQNADHNLEIFLYRPASLPPMKQVTVSTKGDNARPRLSRDGRYVFFQSTSEYFEDAPDHARYWLYRYDIDTDTLTRSGGLSFEDTINAYWPAVDTDGSTVAYTTFTNSNGKNVDDYWELMLADYKKQNPPVVSPGPAPTTVSFYAEPGVIRYDVIRGDVANLQNLATTVNLGTVSCVEDDSGDTTTAGHADPTTPAPGHGFFYLFRGTMGLSAGPGSYGRSSSGKERVAGAGDCGV